MRMHLPLKVTQVVSDRLSWKSIFLQEDCVSKSDYKMTGIKMNDEGRLLEWLSPNHNERKGGVKYTPCCHIHSVGDKSWKKEGNVSLRRSLILFFLILLSKHCVSQMTGEAKSNKRYQMSLSPSSLVLLCNSSNDAFSWWLLSNEWLSRFKCLEICFTLTLPPSFSSFVYFMLLYSWWWYFCDSVPVILCLWFSACDSLPVILCLWFSTCESSHLPPNDIVLRFVLFVPSVVS